MTDHPELRPGPQVVQSARASGRHVRVTTYSDGDVPITATLVFHAPEDAQRFVDRVLGVEDRTERDAYRAELERLREVAASYLRGRIPQCTSTCPHGDQCTRDSGHDGGHNHRICGCGDANGTMELGSAESALRALLDSAQEDEVQP